MYDTSTPDYSTTANSGSVPAGVWVLYIAFIALMVTSMWKVFTKAGKPGWAALVPIYNTYVQLKIVGRPGWWLLLLFVPVVNIIIAIIIYLDLAKVFGRSPVFAIFGLLIFPYVGFPMLAFGKDVYTAPGGTPAMPAAAAPVAPSVTPPSTPPTPPTV
jgi:hypothetical protein